MAFGSITTVTATHQGGSTESVLPADGMFVASADSVVDFVISWHADSGNTGELTGNLYTAIGGLNSATTDWDDTPVIAASFESTGDTWQRSFSVNGYYAYRWGFTHSSNSNSGITLGYRID